LTRWDLWTDELHTISVSASGQYSFGPAYRTAPVNFVMTRYALRVFGVNELGARLIPFLAGIVTVGLLYLFARTWVGERPALFAGLILAVLVWHVFWSQTARHFSVETLAVLLALQGFVSYWTRDRLVGAVAASGWMLLALFTHSSAGFYLAALLAFVAGSWAHYRLTVGRSRHWSAEDRKHAVIGGLLLLALVVYLPIYVAVGRYLLDNVAPWNPAWNLLGSLAFHLPPWLLVPALAGALFLHQERNALGALLASMIVVPIGLLLSAAPFTTASAAYCLPTALAVAVLAGVAGDRLLAAGTAAGRLGATAIALCGILIAELGDLSLYHTFYNGLKPRWRDVAAFIRSHRSPEDRVVAAEADVVGYYLGDRRVEWLDRYQHVGSRDGLGGIWYAVYADDRPLVPLSEQALDEIRASARIAAIYPAHYGPKDRTIAVYYASPPTSPPR
jgi:4-amino-4-deoxy-L-arabinose transferase-like glycosyltransferase